MILQLHMAYQSDTPWWQKVAEAVTDHADKLDTLGAELNNLKSQLNTNDDTVKAVVTGVATDLQNTKNEVLAEFTKE